MVYRPRHRPSCGWRGRWLTLRGWFLRWFGRHRKFSYIYNTKTNLTFSSPVDSFACPGAPPSLLVAVSFRCPCGVRRVARARQAEPDAPDLPFSWLSSRAVLSPPSAAVSCPSFRRRPPLCSRLPLRPSRRWCVAPVPRARLWEEEEEEEVSPTSLWSSSFASFPPVLSFSHSPAPPRSDPPWEGGVRW